MLKDLSTSYGTVLYLDKKELPPIPADLLVVKQSVLANYFDHELTDASKTALIIAYLIQSKIKGLATVKDFHTGLEFKPNNFIETKEFESILHDKRTLKEHAI